MLYSNDLGWHTCTWWWGPLGSLSIYRKLFISQSGHFCAPSALGFILERGPQKTFSFPLRIADGDALGVMQNQPEGSQPLQASTPWHALFSLSALPFLSLFCLAPALPITSRVKTVISSPVIFGLYLHYEIYCIVHSFFIL